MTRLLGFLAAALFAATVPSPALSPGNGTLASLPIVTSGHRPGPDILYAPPPQAPQLENAGVWKADPILVSGAWAYRDGEFLYQDFLYDDHGAAGATDPGDVTGSSTRHFTNFAFNPWKGTLTYPTDPAFANNGADLVELRVRRLGGATGFRITLNSMVDPERAAFTIAIGNSSHAMEWPHGARVRSPAELFLTVHGDSAELRAAGTGRVLSPQPTVAVNLDRRQFDVRVRRSAWDPGEQTVRLAAGVGLWDPEADGYLGPGLEATHESPGGRAPGGAALFNVAFRFDEPLPDWELIKKTYSLGDAVAASTVDAAWWRERAQADVLRSGDISAFFADVDFSKLASKVDDDSGIPMTARSTGSSPADFRSDRASTTRRCVGAPVCLAWAHSWDSCRRMPSISPTGLGPSAAGGSRSYSMHG